jgi:hypothetical protein
MLKSFKLFEEKCPKCGHEKGVILNNKPFVDARNIIETHLYDMGIIKKSDNKKKINQIVKSTLFVLIRHLRTIDNIRNFINEINNDEILDFEIFEEGGDISNYIKRDRIPVCLSLWKERPILKTPNSASGEGELMFLFISKYIKQPKKGDLLVDNKRIEIKGHGARVFGNISGKNFLRKTLKLLTEFNNKYSVDMNPNISKSNIKAVELEKNESHWRNELNKLSLEKRKEFVKRWLECMNCDYPNIENDLNRFVDEIFKNDDFDKNILREKIAIILFKNTKEKEKFEKYMILGSITEVSNKEAHTDIKIIDDDIEKDIKDGKVKVLNDYFRINQDFKIGWYIS